MLERINLVPQPALAGWIKRRTPWTFFFLLGIGCVAAFFIGSQLDVQNRRLKSEIALLEQRQRNQQEQLLFISQISTEIKVLERVEQELRKVVANLMLVPLKKQHYSDLLAGVSEILPATVRCEKIDLEGTGGQISGKATEYDDLPGFVQRLSDMDCFHSVSLSLLNQGNENDKGLLDFKIVFGLRQQE